MKRDLDAGRWARLQGLFGEVVGCAPAQRRRLLLEMRAQEPELYDELVGMIEADAGNGLLDFEPTLQWNGDRRSVAVATARFEAGERVADRFLIIGLLGVGGMGEVYEAVDEELHERVALKTLRAGSSQKGAEDRLRREVRLARRVSHPAVCRMFDVFVHGSAAGDSSPPLLLASMELLRGETLSSRIRRGRLSVPEVLAVTQQVTAGLDAAHRQGIVHRDLKSANIHLLAEESSQRVVITDFGLAVRPRPDAPADEALTASGTILGTPAAIAPEQLTGGEVTPATDIYALGILLFEMVTGKPPFSGGATLELAMRRLSQPPPSPRSVRPGLPRHWERTILRCLELEPSRRFQRAPDVLRALERPAPSRLLWPAAAVLVAASLFTGVVIVHPFDDRPRAAGESPGNLWPGVAETRRIAILEPRNLSRREEVGWMSTALAEMLTLELAGGGLNTLPTEEVATMERELSVAPSVTLSRNTLVGVQRFLDCDVAILGGFFASPADRLGRLRLDLWVEDLRHPATIGSFSVEGSEETMLDLVAEAGDRLRSILMPGGAPSASAGTGAPQGREPARLYALGLEAMRRYDAGAARALLLEAVRLEPEAAMLHVALADAWQALGRDREALDAAKRAAGLAAALPTRQRWLVEGRFEEARRSWEAAIESYRRLTASTPGDVDGIVRYALALTRGGRARSAIEELLAARRRGVGIDNPRFELAIAAAHEALGDHRSALAAARDAVRLGRALGAQRMVALAELREAGASWRLGNLDDARQAAEGAVQSFAKIGDRAAQASALNLQANVAENVGQRSMAEELYRRALSIYQELGHRRGTMIELNNLGLLASQRGALQEARHHHEEALAIALEIDHQEGAATQLQNLGLLAQTEGSFEQAERLYDRARSAAAEIGVRDLEMLAINGLGEIAAEQGQLEEAELQLRQALSIARQLGLQADQAELWTDLGVMQRRRGDLGEAMNSHRQALAMAREMANPLTTATSLMLLGEELRLVGRLSEAEGALAEAHGLHQTLEDPAGLAEVLLTMLRMRCERRQLSLARDLAEEARQLAANSADDGVVALTRWTEAELAVAEGRWTTARELALQASSLFASPTLRLGRYATTALAAEASRQAGDVSGARQLFESMAPPESLDLAIELEWQLLRLRLHDPPDAAAESQLEQLSTQARQVGLLPLAMAAELQRARWATGDARLGALRRLRTEAAAIDARQLAEEATKLLAS